MGEEREESRRWENPLILGYTSLEFRKFRMALCKLLLLLILSYLEYEAILLESFGFCHA